MGVFLSTPSARRATPEWRGMLRSGCNFYPRPPRGGRRRGVWLFSTCPHISIHALREEGDVCAIYDISELISFLSTPSARRATCCGPRGGDSGCYFYPRPPRGGRHSSPLLEVILAQFLSTPSARRATSRRAIRSLMGAYFYPRPPRGGRQSCPHSRLQRLGISIHALREEGDLHPGDVDWPPVISIHALREEGDISSSAVFSAMGVFLSTPSARRATNAV